MNTAIILQAAGGEQGGGYSFFIMMGILFVVMYFFMIRPQAKKAKEAKKFRENLAVGSKVVTIGGIHGKVLDINDRTVLLQVDSGKIRVEKSAVSADSSANEQEITAKR